MEVNMKKYLGLLLCLTFLVTPAMANTVKENNYSEEAMEEFNGMLPHHFNSNFGIYFFKENNYQSNKTL